MGFPGQRRGWCGRCFTYPWRSSRMHRSGSMAMALVGVSRQWTVSCLCGTTEKTLSFSVQFFCCSQEGDHHATWHVLCPSDLRRRTSFSSALNTQFEQLMCFHFWETDWKGGFSGHTPWVCWQGRCPFKDDDWLHLSWGRTVGQNLPSPMSFRCK